MQHFCIHKTFDDFDEFTEAAQGWDIDFKQLQSGPFKGQLLQYIQHDIQFGRATMNNRIEQLGSPPKGLRTFAIPTVSHLRLTWCGMQMPPDSVLIFQPHRGLDCVSWNDFDMFVFTIPQSRMTQLCHDFGYPYLPATIEQSDIIRCRPMYLQSLRRILAQTETALKSADNANAQTQDIIQNTIPIMLLNALASRQNSMTAHPKRLRANVINLIKQHLTVSEDRIPKIHELCRTFHVSERTLEYAFREHFGISPKQYIKILRLNQVRKALRQNASRKIKIVDIANNSGFWHMGQFAADYRKLFSELPSQTLEKSHLL